MRLLESQLEPQLELPEQTVAHLGPPVEQLAAAPVPGHLGQLAAELAVGPAAAAAAELAAGLAAGPVAGPVAGPGLELADLAGRSR